MSEQNLEVARRALDAWNAGDMDRLRELYDPHAVYVLPSDWVDAGPYFGRDAIMKQFEELRQIWQGSSFESPELIEANGSVVVKVDFSGDARGLPLTTEVAWVYTMRGDRIIRCEFFPRKSEALAAVGLSE
jgi:ketosteroid isomerase-like protein